MSVVDAHVHLWDPERLSYPWLEGLEALQRSFLPADYDAACGGAEVSKRVFVECACDAAQRAKEVAWVSGLAASDSRLAGIVAQVPLEQGGAVRDELQRLAKNPLVKGVRRVLQGEESGFCRQTPLIEGVRLLAEYAFTFDLCIQHDQFGEATDLVRACPGTQFVLDHCGKPGIKAHLLDPWHAEIRELASLPNVACKVSGLLTEADPEAWTVDDLKPYVETVFQAFGPDRVLFAGDWPVCTLARDGLMGWIDAVRQLVADRSSVEQEKFFAGNATRLYRLS